MDRLIVQSQVSDVVDFMLGWLGYELVMLLLLGLVLVSISHVVIDRFAQMIVFQNVVYGTEHMGRAILSYERHPRFWELGTRALFWSGLVIIAFYWGLVQGLVSGVILLVVLVYVGRWTEPSLRRAVGHCEDYLMTQLKGKTQGERMIVDAYGTDQFDAYLQRAFANFEDAEHELPKWMAKEWESTKSSILARHDEVGAAFRKQLDQWNQEHARKS